MNTLNKFNVKVSKENLLTSLRKHREEHDIDYRKAARDHSRLMEAALEKKLAKVKEAIASEDMEKIRKACESSRVLDVSAPENHKGMFDKVILMVEASVDDVILLDSHQFECWMCGEFPETTRLKALAAGYATMLSTDL